jgi:hypothetical protein
MLKNRSNLAIQSDFPSDLQPALYCAMHSLVAPRPLQVLVAHQLGDGMIFLRPTQYEAATRMTGSPCWWQMLVVSFYVPSISCYSVPAWNILEA